MSKFSRSERVDRPETESQCPIESTSTSKAKTCHRETALESHDDRHHFRSEFGSDEACHQYRILVGHQVYDPRLVPAE